MAIGCAYVSVQNNTVIICDTTLQYLLLKQNGVTEKYHEFIATYFDEC